MKKDRAATEEKIYKAFLTILEKKGPQGVGINAIAKEAGVSKELIYRYFGGIKGLLLHYAKQGDFFKPLTLVNDDDTSSTESLKLFYKKSIEELQSNKLTQEILRWQLLENNEVTKDLFRYTNAQFSELFPKSENNPTLDHAYQLMIGGYIYFILLSKFNGKFINTNLRDQNTWDEFDKALEKTIELFDK